MELSSEVMEAMNQLMTKQLTEVTRSISTQLQQQIEELSNKVDQRFKERAQTSRASEHSSSEPLSPNAAMRQARGKAIMGPYPKVTRSKTATSHAENREIRFMLGGNTRTEGEHRRTTRVARRHVYIDSEPEHSEGDNSDHSQETLRRNRNRRQDRDYDPLTQQLKHLKIQYPSFHGTNDPEAYLDWERKMESNFQVQGTYEINKVKIAISEFHGYALLWWEQLGLTRQY